MWCMDVVCVRACGWLFCAALVAICAPYFGTVLGRVGGLTDSFQAFVLPPLIYMQTHKGNVGRLRRMFYRGIVGIGLGIILYTVSQVINSITGR